MIEYDNEMFNSRLCLLHAIPKAIKLQTPGIQIFAKFPDPHRCPHSKLLLHITAPPVITVSTTDT
jgi:hypothetical protein